MVATFIAKGRSHGFVAAYRIYSGCAAGSVVADAIAVLVAVVPHVTRTIPLFIFFYRRIPRCRPDGNRNGQRAIAHFILIYKKWPSSCHGDGLWEVDNVTTQNQ
jgi:hypothetical protein